MKLQAAEWKRTTVTKIRANDLWNKPQLGNAQSYSDKLNGLFFELRDAALSPLPAETKEARLSTVPLIDDRYNATLADIMAMINTWVEDDPVAIAATGAKDPEGTLYRDYGEGHGGAAAHAAYAELIDHKIQEYYNAAKSAYDAAVAAGGYSGTGWVLSSWEAEQTINQRKKDFLPYALTYMGPMMAEVAVRQPEREYEILVRDRIGKPLESAQAWKTLEESYFNAAVDKIYAIGRSAPKTNPTEGIVWTWLGPHIEHKTTETKTEDLPSELRAARHALAGKQTVYKDGQSIVLLSMPCEEVQSTLRSLDSLFYVIAASTASVQQIYSSVYKAYVDYLDLRCSAPAEAPTTKPLYERVVVLTTDTFPAQLRASLQGYWESISTWPAIEEKAAALGLSQELAADKDAAFAQLLKEIERVQKDPWGGPLGRDPTGAIVPYAGIDIGKTLYTDWIISLAYAKYKIIRDKYLYSTATPKPADFVPTQGYVNALAAKYKQIWDTDPIRGTALAPDSIKASVLDPAWATFVSTLNSTVGAVKIGGLEQYKKDVEEEYVKAVLTVRAELDRLQTGSGKEFPPRLAEIEGIIKGIEYSGLTLDQVQSLFAEVKMLHSAVPWNDTLQKRYDAIYQAFTDYLAPGGGATKITYATYNNEYSDREISSFIENTARDKALAEWLGMDYSAHYAAWEASFKDGLRELLNRTDLTDDSFIQEQAAALKAATDRYLSWRSQLIDNGRALLQALAAAARSGTITPENQARAEKGAELVHPFLMNEITDLGVALKQMLPGGMLSAAGLKPFAKFTPLKSTSGFDVEEFSFKHMRKFIDNWAESRITDGCYVDPKINGYRTVLEFDGKDTRIYLEGTDKDYSRLYTHLTEELKTLPPVILDGELIEKKGSRVTPRAELSKFRSAAVDDSNIFVQIFDILYLDGEDLHDKPYEERLAIRNKFFAGRSLKHMHNLPSWRVSTIDGLLKKAKEADSYSGCFLPDSLVFDGVKFRRADTFVKGQRIFGERNVQHVKVVDNAHYDGDVYTIKPAYLPGFTVTAEHPIAVIHNYWDRPFKHGYWYVKAHPKGKFNLTPHWVLPADINEGDFVIMPKYKLSRSFIYPTQDEDMYKILGWYAAEGWTEQGAIVFAIHRDEISEVSDLLSRKFSTVKIQEIPNEPMARTIRVYNAKLARWLKKHFGAHSYEKRIPESIMLAPPNLVRAYLQGYWKGDGCLKHDDSRVGLRFTTSSHQMAMQVQVLLTKLNMLGGLSKITRAGVPMTIRGRTYLQRNLWNINVWGQQLFAFIERSPDNHINKPQFLDMDDVFVVPVRKITRRKYSGNIINIQPDNHLIYTPVRTHNSEGAMFKTPDSKYLLARRTGEWAKVKSTSDIQVMVLGIKKTAADDFVYKGGVEARDTKGITPSEIETYNGKKYVILGNTFRTPEKAKLGDHIEVSVTEIVEQSGDKGKKYNWMLPKVKGLTDRPVDTLAYVKQVGQLLSASMMQPWQLITDIVNKTMSTTSAPVLRKLKAQVFEALGDVNNARVRNFGWAAIDLIRGRLGQTANPAINQEGEKIYNANALPLVTTALLSEVEDRLKGLIDDIQSSPQQKADRAKELRSMLTQYAKEATEPILSEVNRLTAQVDDFIHTMEQAAGASSQSIIDIQQKLSVIANDLDNLIRAQPDTLVDDLQAIKSRLRTLISTMGNRQGYFSEAIDALTSKIEGVEIPAHNSADIRSWLNITRALMGSAIERLAKDSTDSSSRFLLSVTVPMQLNQYWDELTDTQKSVFKADFDMLRDVLKSVKDMYSGIGGALLYAATMPLKIDLGCGDSKASGYIGIDKRNIPGVDKVFDLEIGIPYPDGSVAVVRAYHVLEHLSDPIKIMGEIHRVLRDGGVLKFEIPSTKGEGADADPTHKSRWNKSSFAFYTDDKLRESHDVPFKFDLVKIEEFANPDKDAVYVRGTLRAVKPGTPNNTAYYGTHTTRADNAAPAHDLTAATKLTEEGEQAGEKRLDFMAKEPSDIPVKGTLWTHVKGIDPEHESLDYDEMMKLSTKDDVLSLHHDLRFNWGKNFLEGVTLFLGNQDDKDKLLDYEGGKLGATVKLSQPVVWGEDKELANREFPPHTPGNVTGKDTWGKMFKIADVLMLPSRMRPKPKGKRYFEWYMKIEGYPKLTGLWALSEEASSAYDLPFMLWKQKDITPFWLRGGKDHEKEIAGMPDWQKPTQEGVNSFLSQSLKAASEFDADVYKNADYGECAECYAKLLELGNPHGSTKYTQAKKKADEAIAIAKKIEGGVQCKKYGILVADLVQAFVAKAERLWKLQKGIKEFTRE